MIKSTLFSSYSNELEAGGKEDKFPPSLLLFFPKAISLLKKDENPVNKNQGNLV
jgi:hypothetical protein